MDPISNVLVNRAGELFTGNNNTAAKPVDEPIINLETNEPVNTSHVGFQPPIELPISPKIEVETIPTNTNVNTDLSKLKAVIYSMQDQLEAMLRFINGEQTALQNKTAVGTETLETGEKIIEGIFNGENMLGLDGKEYNVPPNYASKSKLVEGDKMKLTITNNGKFIYKQIIPAEKRRLIGELVSDAATGQWSVVSEGKMYKVLTASVTFYKGKPGDDVIFFIAKDRNCFWGAVENIINKSPIKN